jgi:hypothetical protein
MKGGDTFNLKDMVTDQETGKASLDKIVVFFFSLLSAWVIVVFVLDGKNVETLLFGVLSIFILNKAATTVIDSNKNSSKKE